MPDPPEGYQSPADVAEHQAVVDEALRTYYRPAKERPTGEDLPNRLRYHSRQELADELAAHLFELERRSVFVMLAAVEAAFRIDYLERCERRRPKGKLTTAFRTIYLSRDQEGKEKREHVRLVDDILRTWQNHEPQLKSALSELIGYLKYRDWLAHGRYWHAKLGQSRYTFEDMYDRLMALLTALPLVGWTPGAGA